MFVVVVPHNVEIFKNMNNCAINYTFKVIFYVADIFQTKETQFHFMFYVFDMWNTNKLLVTCCWADDDCDMNTKRDVKLWPKLWMTSYWLIVLLIVFNCWTFIYFIHWVFDLHVLQPYSLLRFKGFYNYVAWNYDIHTSYTFLKTPSAIDGFIGFYSVLFVCSGTETLSFIFLYFEFVFIWKKKKSCKYNGFQKQTLFLFVFKVKICLETIAANWRSCSTSVNTVWHSCP